MLLNIKEFDNRLVLRIPITVKNQRCFNAKINAYASYPDLIQGLSHLYFRVDYNQALIPDSDCRLLQRFLSVHLQLHLLRLVPKKLKRTKPNNRYPAGIHFDKFVKWE